MFKTKRSKLKEVELALETLRDDLRTLSVNATEQALESVGDRARFKYFQGESEAFSKVKKEINDILFDIVY